MYDYIGDTWQGERTVCACRRPRIGLPAAEEIRLAMGEMRELSDRPAAFSSTERSEILRRRDRVVRGLNAAAAARMVERLEHRPRYAEDGFRWGYASYGAFDLARAILLRELDAEPRVVGYHAFAKDVVEELPADFFHLRGEEVQAWLEANVDLVHPAVARREVGRPSGPALAVTDVEVDGDSGSGEVDEPTASALVRACEDAWAAIKAHHPDLPDAVIILGSGVERGRLVKLGHWWAGRWLADGEVRGEVLLAGEALHLPPEQVFEVLLHEAAHGLNAARGIKDTSRGGRYHNQRFASAAQEVLLKVRGMPPYGLAATEVTAEALDRYEAAIARIGEVMRIARQLGANREVGAGGEEDGAGTGTDQEGTTGRDGRDKQSGTIAAVCGCGRRMRMSPTVFQKGDVVCAPCGTAFRDAAQRDTPGHAVDPEPEGRSRISQAFMARRRAALQSEGADQLSGAQLAAIREQLRRLDAVVAVGSGVAGLTPLLERAERMRDVAGAGQTPEAPLAGSQLEGLLDLQALGPNDDEIEELSEWYRRAGRLDETPMVAGSGDRDRLVGLARALFKLDGTIHGPTVAFGDLEVQAGDRLIADNYVAPADLDAGSIGTVRRVDTGRRVVIIDFATAGVLTAGPKWLADAGIRHDYVASEELEPRALDADVGDEKRDAQLEAGRLLPEAGW